MKLVPLAHEKKSNRMKMIITETQLRALASNVLILQEQKQIKNTHLIKTKTDVKK